MSSPLKSPKKESQKLPETFYPDCWTDDVRMDALFSPFRVYDVNPENYKSKLNFWRNLIKKYCEEKGSSDISINELKIAFKRKDKSPYGLETVFNEMEQDLKIENQFLEPPQHSWSGWAVNMMKKPVKWGFNKVKERVIQTKDDNTKFIIIEIVQLQSEILFKHFEHLSETVVTLKDILNGIEGCGLSKDGTKLALHQLDCQQKVFIEKTDLNDDPEKILIKFAGLNQKVTPITDFERSVYKLELEEKCLMKVIEKFEIDIKEADQQTRAYLKDGKKQLAKNCLRKKHTLEKNMEKRASTLENTQTLLSRIHETVQDRQTIEAFKTGSKTLKTVLSDSGITLDSVDETVAEVQEVLELHDDIQTTLGNTKLYNFDESELEKELEDLLATDGDSGTGGGTEDKRNALSDSILKQLDGLNISGVSDLGETVKPSIERSVI